MSRTRASFTGRIGAPGRPTASGRQVTADVRPLLVRGNEARSNATYIRGTWIFATLGGLVLAAERRG
jgi:hypothetical protein